MFLQLVPSWNGSLKQLLTETDVWFSKWKKGILKFLLRIPFFFLLMILLKIRPLLLLTDLILELKNSWADSCFSLLVTAGKAPGLSPYSTTELLFSCLSPVQLGNCTCLFGHIRFPLVIYAPSLRQWFLMGLFPASLHHWLQRWCVMCPARCVSSPFLGLETQLNSC